MAAHVEVPVGLAVEGAAADAVWHLAQFVLGQAVVQSVRRDVGVATELAAAHAVGATVTVVLDGSDVGLVLPVRLETGTGA